MKVDFYKIGSVADEKLEFDVTNTETLYDIGCIYRASLQGFYNKWEEKVYG